MRLNKKYPYLLKKYRGIIMDTSFLIQCVKSGAGALEEIEAMGLSIYVPDKVVEELNRLADRPGRRGQLARLSLKLINKFKVIDSGAVSADNAIIKLSTNGDYVIATTDLKLIKSLTQYKIPIICLDKNGNLIVR